MKVFKFYFNRDNSFVNDFSIVELYNTGISDVSNLL